MNREIVWTTQFKKDDKKAMKRHMDMDLLDHIIRALSRGETLPERNKDHSLTGDWVGHRECHIQPDWLLVYRMEEDVLVLTAGVILLLRVFSAAGSAAQRFSGLLSQCGLDSAPYLPVCKAVGVAVVVRIAAALCRDAGQSALAAKMEIAGAVLTLSVCLPLFEQVLDLITEWAV